MREDDFAYLNRRASEELVAARNATDMHAARIHLELADRMRQRAEELKPTMTATDAADAA